MEKRRVLTVLRSGGDFRPEHVQALSRQIERHAPGAEFQCLSDVDVEGVDCIPLKHDWPGWWAKIELFRLDGEFLYTDLDNVFLGPIHQFFPGKYTTQEGGWNALMYVVPGLHWVYDEFAHAPGEHMALNQPTGIEGKAFGDAGFVAARVRGECWDDVAPKRVVNICHHLGGPWPFQRPEPLPPETSVLLCSRRHGRPWNLPEFRALYGDNCA